MGPGLQRNPLDDGDWGNWSTLAVKAERRRLQKTSHKPEEWTDAAAIASWDAAFEGLRDFYDLDASLQRYVLLCSSKFLNLRDISLCNDNDEPGYVEIDDGGGLGREWV
jgi:hypothetical protein